MIKFTWALKSSDFTSSVRIAMLISLLKQIPKIMIMWLKLEEQETMSQ
jgi:hypothetical protein